MLAEGDAVDGYVSGTGYSACPHDCPSTCALEVELLPDGDVGRIHGSRDNTYTSGVVCAKVARYAERVHHPDRILRPLLRAGPKGTHQFREIGWDEALDRVAERFVEQAGRLGAETVWPYYYAGTMGLVQRDGLNRLRHAMGYSDQKYTICTGLCDAGWLAGTGTFRGPDPREMADSDLIISWGGNPASTQVNVMTHVQRARKLRGAKLVVVDPYRTRTAQVADLHLCLRPGTDGALACAIMHVLFRDGYADRAYLERNSDCPGQLEAHLASRTPAWAARITGLGEGEIEVFARLIGETERTYIRIGYGFTRSRNGAANVHAVTSIATVGGKWRHTGGGAFYSNRDIYHWDKTLIEGLDVRDPAVRTLDMSRIGPVLTNAPTDLGDGPPVTAMLVQNTNPADVAPELGLVHRGLARDDLFLCVHEQFPTETVRYADVVLPATTFLEHDDVYQGGGHQHVLFGPKLIEPRGEARANHRVVCDLAKRLGAEHPGFTMTEREIIDATLRASGHGPLARLEAERWRDVQPDFSEAHFESGFGFPDGKFRFSPDWCSIGPDHAGMPLLPDHLANIEDCDADHPFRLVTAPAHNFLNTSFTETPTSQEQEARPTARIHPDDLAALEIKDGDPVRLGNRRGDVLVHAQSFAGLQPGVVVVEGIWPGNAFVEGRGINTLVGSDAGPPNGGPAYHDAAVWLRAG
ncbi:MAG: molybdopterin oxidoreductase family protein [Rhodospirillales bacterium]|nr:molybdopterin oxidoreductase family protein [Rhodospirillales bacterium]